MGTYRIRGGRKLSGSIQAESAKNAVLPILAASILTDEEVVIRDCPADQRRPEYDTYFMRARLPRAV